ncbi:MAG: hypothetical protein ABIF85_06135 [Nanoarchaeota archaeon]
MMETTTEKKEKTMNKTPTCVDEPINYLSGDSTEKLILKAFKRHYEDAFQKDGFYSPSIKKAKTLKELQTILSHEMKRKDLFGSTEYWINVFQIYPDCKLMSQAFVGGRIYAIGN